MKQGDLVVYKDRINLGPNLVLGISECTVFDSDRIVEIYSTRRKVVLRVMASSLKVANR